MPVYSGMYGTCYTTGKTLGSGGEGTIYSLTAHGNLVAKIYNPGKFHNEQERKQLERKLKTMISMNISTMSDGITRLAWPQDIIYENGKMAGFIMPKIDSKYKIYDLYRGGKNSMRDKVYPGYNWKYGVQFAWHLAWTTEYLHSRGIVIGDFNQTNIAIDTRHNTVILIDCDSFDIRDPVTGEHFPCCVGLDEMLAPELQMAGDLSKAEFTEESDNFSLAIHIFRLLMDNADPFGGRITSRASVSSIPMNRAICNGECVYVRKVPGKEIPKWAPKPSMLPPDVLELFTKTFNYTARTAVRNIANRATAGEWRRTLEPYGAPEPNQKLKKCLIDPTHIYPAHNQTCPWCRNTSAVSVNTGGKREKKRDRRKKRSSAGKRRAFGLTAAAVILSAAAAFVWGTGGHFEWSDIPYHNEISGMLSDLAEGIAALKKEIFADETSVEEQEAEALQEETQTPGQEEAPAAGTAASGQYILPDSSTVYLTEADLAGFTAEELRLARNEIYARHGRAFKTEWIRDYFEEKNWYEPLYDADYFDSNLAETALNEYEKANAEFILVYENR